MMFEWLKNLMPRGLYGRAALILIVPIVTIQLVVSIMFIQRHFEDVTQQMTTNVVLEVAFIADQVASAPDQDIARARIAALEGPLALDFSLPADTLPEDRRVFYDLSGRVVMSTLRAALPSIEGIDLGNLRVVRLGMSSPHGPMEIAFDRRRVSASNPHQLLVLMLGTGLFMTLIAFFYLRNQLRPIKRLAEAAEGFGKGRIVPYKPSGAQEVRSAGNAFLDMRARIERQIEQRTLMLSGVSHDLRTPLTRMRLELSLMEPSEAVSAMERDVDDMQRLLDAFLDFARGDATDGEAELVDPVALVRDLVEAARRGGQPVELGSVTGEGLATLRPVSVQRAVENLIGNAVRYGSRAEVSITILERAVRISVEDDGPGIPKDRRDEALRPFTRLDAARNQDKGSGVGLGLSITADTARSHGGALRLTDSEKLGGLKAELILAR